MSTRRLIESLEIRRLLSTWVGGSSASWHDPNNWSPPVVPGPDDGVELVWAGTVVVNQDVTIRGMFSDSSQLLIDNAKFTATEGLALEHGADFTLANGSTLEVGGGLTVEGKINVGVIGDPSENRLKVLDSNFDNFNGAGMLLFSLTSVLDLTQSSSMYFRAHPGFLIDGPIIEANPGVTFRGDNGALSLENFTTTAPMRVANLGIGGEINLGGDLTLGISDDYNLVVVRNDAVIHGPHEVLLSSDNLSVGMMPLAELTISPEVTMRVTGNGGIGSLINLGTIVVDGSELEPGEDWSFGRLMNSGSMTLQHSAKVEANAVGFVNELTTRDTGTQLLLHGEYVLGDTEIDLGSTMYLESNSWAFSSMNINGTVIFDHEPDNGTIFNHIRDKVTSGYANNTWTGNGLRDSLAAANPRYTLGYGASNVILGPDGGMFEDVEVDSTAVIVHHSLDADFNLDDVVNFDDLLKLAHNYDGPFGKSFTDGDTNFDRLVRFPDLLTAAQLYGQSLFSSQSISRSNRNDSFKLQSILE